MEPLIDGLMPRNLQHRPWELKVARWLEARWREVVAAGALWGRKLRTAEKL